MGRPSLEDIVKQERAEWLEDMGFDSKLVASSINRDTYAPVETMQASYDYVTQELGLDVKVLETFPQLFGLSIKNRIIPRWEFAKSKNKTNVTLDYLFIPNDTVFANRMGTDVAHYHRFRDERKDFIEETYKSLIKAVAESSKA